MCGRYTDSRRKKELMVRFGFQADLAFTPRYNIAPTQQMECYPVSTAVNNVRNEIAECVERIAGGDIAEATPIWNGECVCF